MGVCRICQAGQLFFFGGYTYIEACDAWRSHAFARGFGGMLYKHIGVRNIFLNGAIWCVLEYIFIIFLLSKV